MIDNASLSRIDKDSVTRKSLNEITAPVSEHLSEFRGFFKDTIKTDVFLLDQILRYLHKQKGKELRPTLVFMTANLFDGISERSHIAATMIELLHTATLIHDDVVDEANSRRGFVSINKIWKNKAGVLLGDFLLSRGLLVSLENKEYKLLEVQSKAVQKMSEGELRQLKTAGLFNMTEDRYFQIISEKTASLISTCCECGAVSATDDEKMHELMASIGMCIGIAFQIRDDLFDYGMYDIGKPKRNDIQERKVTLPLIKALEHSSKKESARIRALMKKRKKTSKDIDEIVAFVHDKGGMDYAKKSMYDYANQAIEGLEKLPESQARIDFTDLIHYVITRKK
ncbi:MAG TPA: polyprenyl synthetase [Balneola sp.]|jgi:octaprenyl-diphosphate synthase|nr:polyprenyl synthetase [Bacteroidota bacterium]MAC04570.1 polyprenyl synthetase [Balneola sp.]MAO76722.1 polyprenyl synthetase [Balneola sp.]MBF65129.1 polyprenyl synthetase [Balneola sp.]HAH51403.1 polyprenyl synthetase [Balneola sp.]|tara:strand:- start:26493 stop:27512 length:1020 start_codon:yes stop_codon:yes gene_type:complete